MTHTIVFLPGIMGSRLSLGDEEVWPPKALETIRGYKRLDKLTDPAVRPTRIIRKVACFGFYDTILDNFAQLGYKPGDPNKRLLALAYDWRQDLFDTAEKVADVLDAEIGTPAAGDTVSIVAHSMGGLISRLILEPDTYRNRAWFNHIDTFITLATPHLGAPLALARTLGLDGDVGISPADFKRLTKDARYPSGYQLLPAPGEDSCWDTNSSGKLEPLDIYDPAVANRLDLEPALIARTKAVHDAFAAGSPPDHIRYFYFAGTGHKTVSRVNVDGTQMTKVPTRGAGDGTVPLWSALPRPTQKHVVTNEHATVFRGDSFRNVFFALFGAHVGPVDLETAIGSGPTASLSRQVYRIDDRADGIEVVIDSSEGISELTAQIVIEEVDDEGARSGGYSNSFPLAYSGGALRTLVMDLDMPDKPGFYQLRLEMLEEGEEPLNLIEPLPFSVTQ